MSFHIVFLLQKQPGTRERDFFRHGPLTRDWLSARKSVIIEAEEWRGDLRSLGRTQITWKGIDRIGAHTPNTQEYTAVAWEMHRPADGMAFPIVSHGFALVGQGERRPASEEIPL